MTQAGTARSERELEVLTARAKELIRARVPQPLLVVEPFDDGAGAVETPIPVTGEPGISWMRFHGCIGTF